MSLHFLFEIDRLKKLALKLSAMVEDNLAKAVQAIEESDSELARQVVDRDSDIDEFEIEIEEECLKTLALHQPVAKDLRLVVAVLKINNDLERIGDLTVNIAERVEHLEGKKFSISDLGLGTMADVVKQMLKRSLDAVCNLDVSLARQVCIDDDRVDDMNKQVFKKVIDGIAANPERDNVDTFINLLSVARNLERIADHTTNISEDLIYLIQGHIVRHHSEDK